MNAGALLRYAVKIGKVKKPEACQICDSTHKKVQAHHYDYNKPLEVIWCCRSCHATIHRLGI